MAEKTMETYANLLITSYGLEEYLSEEGLCSFKDDLKTFVFLGNSLLSLDATKELHKIGRFAHINKPSKPLPVEDSTKKQ